MRRENVEDEVEVGFGGEKVWIEVKKRRKLSTNA